MICKKCGENVSDDVKFCPKCGTKLSDSVGNNESQTNVVDNSFWSSWSTGKKIGALIVACCVGFMIIGLIGSAIMPDSNTSSSSSSSSDYDTDDHKFKYDDDYSDVQVDKHDLGDYYAWSSLAYDHTDPYTINGVDGYLWVGDGSVEFYYIDGNHYYELVGDLDEKDKVLKKMETMV